MIKMRITNKTYSILMGLIVLVVFFSLAFSVNAQQGVTDTDCGINHINCLDVFEPEGYSECYDKYFQYHWCEKFDEYNYGCYQSPIMNESVECCPDNYPSSGYESSDCPDPVCNNKQKTTYQCLYNFDDQQDFNNPDRDMYCEPVVSDVNCCVAEDCAECECIMDDCSLWTIDDVECSNNNCIRDQATDVECCDSGSQCQDKCVEITEFSEYRFWQDYELDKCDNYTCSSNFNPEGTLVDCCQDDDCDTFGKEHLLDAYCQTTYDEYECVYVCESDWMDCDQDGSCECNKTTQHCDSGNQCVDGNCDNYDGDENGCGLGGCYWCGSSYGACEPTVDECQGCGSNGLGPCNGQCKTNWPYYCGDSYGKCQASINDCSGCGDWEKPVCQPIDPADPVCKSGLEEKPEGYCCNPGEVWDGQRCVAAPSCAEQGGVCCATGEACFQGDFQDSSDCASYCCVGAAAECKLLCTPATSDELCPIGCAEGDSCILGNCETPNLSSETCMESDGLPRIKDQAGDFIANPGYNDPKIKNTCIDNQSHNDQCGCIVDDQFVPDCDENTHVLEYSCETEGCLGQQAIECSTFLSCIDGACQKPNLYWNYSFRLDNLDYYIQLFKDQVRRSFSYKYDAILAGKTPEEIINNQLLKVVLKTPSGEYVDQDWEYIDPPSEGKIEVQGNTFRLNFLEKGAESSNPFGLKVTVLEDAPFWSETEIKENEIYTIRFLARSKRGEKLIQRKVTYFEFKINDFSPPSCFELDPITGEIEEWQSGQGVFNILFIGENYSAYYIQSRSNYQQFQLDVMSMIDYQAQGLGLFSVEPFKSADKSKFRFYLTSPEIIELEDSYFTETEHPCPHDYVVLVSGREFRPTAPNTPGTGGAKPYSAKISLPWRPYSFDRVFIHEFGHTFGGLRDEYTEIGKSNNPGYPNCAPDQDKALAWWGHLFGQGEDELEVVDFTKPDIDPIMGCSYVADNIRPTAESIMNNSIRYYGDKWEHAFGPVNQKHLEYIIEYDGEIPTEP